MTIVNSMPRTIIYFVMFQLYQSPGYWLTVLLSVSFAIFPIYAIRFWILLFADSGSDSRKSVIDPSIRLDQYSFKANDRTPLLNVDL